MNYDARSRHLADIYAKGFRTEIRIGEPIKYIFKHT